MGKPKDCRNSTKYRKGGKGGHPWKWLREDKRPKRLVDRSVHPVCVWRNGDISWTRWLGE